MDIKDADFVPLHFLNRSTIIYGSSGGGKTKTTQNILNALASKLLYLYVFTNGAGSESIFAKYTPKVLIDDKVNIKTIKSIWERQKMLTDIYKKANNLELLESLYSKIKSSSVEKKIGEIKGAKEEIRQKVSKQKHLNKSEKKAIIKTAHDALDDASKSIYKKAIIKNYDDIKEAELNEDQKYALKYANLLEPNMAMVFDDVSSELTELKPKDKAVIYDIMTKCRHHHTTVVITVHDDTALCKKIRAQAFNSIFCGLDKLECYFNKKNTGIIITAKERNAFKRFFSENKDKKILYVREEMQFYSLTVNFEIEPRTIGNSIILAFCNMIEDTNICIKRQNKFYKNFSLSAHGV